jgi:DNA polymerase-3 subunit alpha
MLGFANLHSHTCYSQLDAIIRVNQLFKRAKELGQTAIAVTDHGVMSGIYEAYKASKATGVKLIPGNEIYFVEDLNDEKSKRRHLVLLAANYHGYKNLLKITAVGFQHATVVMGKEYPRVDESILRQYSEGLFATSACGGSIIANSIFHNDMGKAKQYALIFKDIFGDRFFIELQPHNLTRTDKKTGITFDQRLLNHKLKEIAEELNIQMVATCDSHYLTPKHEKYHDMVLAISDKKPLDDLTRHRYATYMSCALCEGTSKYPKDSDKLCISCAGTGIGRILPCPEFYVKSEEEIKAFFKKEYGEEFANRLIINTAKIAAICEEPKYLEPTVDRLPRFDWSHISKCDDAKDFESWLASKPNMQAIREENAYLRYKVWKVFTQYTKDFPVETKKIYWDRLLYEIDILESRNFCSYMLIVADFIDWARKNKIDVGPGRGSCAGCLVAFFLGIHTVDSIKYGLLFERFHNKEKKSLPDIDTDFSPRGRERVVEYVRQKYGPRHVAYISNINTITPKVAISDIARSLNIGGDKSTAFKLAKEITADIPDKVTEDDTVIDIDTMDRALKYSKKLKTFVQEYPELLDYANEIVGLPRAMSTHAAGVIISDIPLDDYVPLRTDKDGRVAVAYDKDTCEEVKLVKIDFLGLDTLDILRDAYEMAKNIGLNIPDPDHIPEYDELTFKLIRSGRVVGCFQLEGTTLAPLCKPLQPNSIEDIALINALGRPGVSKAERQEFIERKAGRKPVTYQHPLLSSILKHTYGIKVYEEDMLHIAAAVAGWDRSKADSLRKIAKLKEKGLELQKKTGAEFIKDSMVFSKISQEEAEMIWHDVILPFGKYGFNKSMPKSTKIKVLNKGDIEIANVLPGDVVVTINSQGQSVESEVVALHDHGEVPMWELEFDDGTIERCSLDHKWLTEYGQQPVWRIMQNDLEIFGLTKDSCKSKNMPGVPRGLGGSGFCSRRINDRYRNRRPATLLSNIWGGYVQASGRKGSASEQRNNTPQKTGSDQARLLQLQILRRAYEHEFRKPFKASIKCDTRNLKGRKIIRAEYLGFMQAYDLEIDHPEHNFVLSSGLCSSNSHAIAYSINSYRTAYYKAHATAPLLCAKLNAETRKSTSTEADIEDIKKDAKSFNIQIKPCDINLSKDLYSISDKKTIVTGLLAIKGLGDKALANIIANQPYASFEDFLYRTSSSAVNKTAIQALAKAGAFDCLGIGRKYASENYETIRKELSKYIKKLSDDYFEMGNRDRPFSNYLDDFKSSTSEHKLDEWDLKDRLSFEKEVLGTYLSGSVEQLFPGFFKGGTYSQSFSRVKQMMSNTSISLEGVVTSCKELVIKKSGKNAGRKFGKLTFENSIGESIEVTVWPDQYDKLIKYFDKVVPLRGTFVVNEYNSEKSLVLNSVERIGV